MDISPASFVESFGLAAVLLEAGSVFDGSLVSDTFPPVADVEVLVRPARRKQRQSDGDLNCAH